MQTCFIDQFIDTFSSCVGALCIFYINSGWPDNQISMDCGRYQNAFSQFGRLRENRMCNVISDFLIKQTIVTPSWGNVNFIFTDHIMEMTGINSGSIYDITGVYHAVTGSYMINTIFSGDILNFCIKPEFYTIHICVFCKCDIQGKRTNDSTGRSEKRSFNIFRKVRFKRKNFFPRKDFQTLNTICNTSVI